LLQYHRANYDVVKKIMRDVYGDQVSEDIQHLLDLIETDFEQRGLFHLHEPLVSMSLYPSLYITLYEQVRFFLGKDDLEAVLKELPYLDTWQADVSTNHVLHIPYNYNPKSYIVPADNTNQTCLNKYQKKYLEVLGKDPTGLKSLTPDLIILIAALQYLDYLSNRTAHRMEHLQNYLKVPKPPQKYNVEDIDLVAL
jgi:hypothetical protein